MLKQHWACKKCLVGIMCKQDCFRIKLPHPYCDEICSTKKQEDCCKSPVGKIISCFKVNKLRMKRGTWFHN